MSGQPFQIPGLGQAKPNETLPSESFAPDLLAAAASLIGVDGLDLDGANGNQSGKQDKRNEQQTQAPPVQETQPASTEAQATKPSEDAMQVDKAEPPAAAEQPGAADQSAGAQPTYREQERVSQGAEKTEDTNMTDGSAAPPSPHVAHALEAALDGLLSTTAQPTTGEPGAPAQVTTANDMEGVEGEHPEWEADSSPYESSSESDSSDSSSDDDSEDEGGYQLLGLEETARLLMAETADGDGGAKGGKGVGGGQVRTKNEVPDEPLPKPDVVITDDMRIEPLGLVQFVVEKTVVVKSQTPGEVQALDTGSVLCRGDRTVIGVLADTIGNVRSPMYTVGFATEEEIKDLELQVGTEIFYSVDHAKYVFTQELKQVKGTDASNLHDEEVAADEMEFSDDEKEAEYKRQLKAKKRGNKTGRGGREHSNQPHQLPNSSGPAAPNGSGSGLNYDEDEDGPYKPLARPANFGQGLPPSLPQLPPKPEMGFGQSRGGYSHRGSSRGGRGDFRGDFRGGRGGRGGRGRDRGGGDRRHDRGGYGGGYGGQRSYGASSSPPNSYSSPRPAQQQPQPPQPPQPPQNPHLPPPPYGATPQPFPAAPPNQWAPAGSPYVPPPPPVVPHLYGQNPVQPPQPPPAAPNFNFNYQAWQQNQAHAYPAYGQQQAHPTPPPQQVQPPQNAYRAPAPASAPTWPPAGVPAPPAGAYVNPAFFAGLQQVQSPHAPVPPPPQQGYWGQPPHGGYGQGNK
ncbi:NAF1-domain-containing protein [Coniochaeta hoffmannii]|uniref:H/ACA ribonucleoprotein complex non-core subunit NAF1 n=1 Tax=Coniochaeta hoffmannii TaxID=91930 RepID=A0AA38VNJ5_9PEZI|nr:NAF1-domain-containing protein [Coniochaeta hoffmannii]